MNWFRSLQTNRSALQTFLILLIGFILLQVAAVYVAINYTARSQHSVSRNALAQDLVRVIRLANVMPITTLQKHVGLLAQHGIPKIQLAAEPLTNSPVIQSTKSRQIRRFAYQHYYDFQASYELNNGQWLIMRGGVHQSQFLVTGFILSEVVLFLILIAFCFWVVQRVALPVGEFAQAARRFGRDVQAPPMAVQGSHDMREVIQAFNEMQGQLRRLIMDRTQMLAAISHDLRTPITRLQLRAEALKGTPHYDKAMNDLNEMEKMISSILSFARDYVRTEPMERFDLIALCDNICNELEDAGLSVTFHAASHRLPYFGRITAIKRALSNLIENAVKYGDQATVDVAAEENQVMIKIRDQGPGIPENEMDNVFTPFYRVDRARSSEKSGAGLGMATARDIIRAHGGDIVLRNIESGGLLVTVSLPNSE